MRIHRLLVGILVFVSPFTVEIPTARTCHCSASIQSCSPEGKCQSPLSEEDFSCFVTRRYNQPSGKHIISQQCISDVIDYALYCNGPVVHGLVFQHRESGDLDICCFTENCNTEDLLMELLANLTTPESPTDTQPATSPMTTVSSIPVTSPATITTSLPTTPDLVTSPITPATTALPPALTPPSDIEAHCSHVNWRNSPDVYCGDITGYDVRLFNPNTGMEVTRRLDARGTFHNFPQLDKELVEQKSTRVQIRIVSSYGEGTYSSPVQTGCFIPPPASVYFELGGERYDNNSAVNILAIGEGSSALLCKTNKQDCCGTVPNRFGEFYYPDGTRVSIFLSGDGFYRNRGNQMIRLNRKDGVSSPTGRYSCEIPDASGVIHKIFININQ